MSLKSRIWILTVVLSFCLMTLSIVRVTLLFRCDRRVSCRVLCCVIAGATHLRHSAAWRSEYSSATTIVSGTNVSSSFPRWAGHDGLQTINKGHCSCRRVQSCMCLLGDLFLLLSHLVMVLMLVFADCCCARPDGGGVTCYLSLPLPVMCHVSCVMSCVQIMALTFMFAATMKSAVGRGNISNTISSVHSRPYRFLYR